MGRCACCFIGWNHVNLNGGTAKRRRTRQLNCRSASLSFNVVSLNTSLTVSYKLTRTNTIHSTHLELRVDELPLPLHLSKRGRDRARAHHPRVPQHRERGA